MSSATVGVDTNASKTYDLAIVGAGPHALSLVSRLLASDEDKYEERPSNKKLFSVSKNGNFQTKVKDNPQTRKTHRQLKVYLNTKQPCFHSDQICVIDKYGCWLTQWAKQFDVLGISHLRSTTSVHPDAFDLHALKAFATEKNRESELTDIARSIRGSDFTGPFIIPSTRLFWDFCKDLVKRHRLENMVKAGTVATVHSATNCYELTLVDGSTVHARRVVIATGSSWVKRIPAWARDIYKESRDRTLLHTSDLIECSEAVGIGKQSDASLPLSYVAQASGSSAKKQYSDLHLESITGGGDWELEDKDVLIIGGGLSSGHLAVKAALLGSSLVHVVCRSSLKIRQFDLGLEWIGRNRFKKLAGFFSIQDFQQRLHSIKCARSGGSVTPSVFDCLLKLQDENRVKFYEQTEVWSCERVTCGDRLRWKCDLSHENPIFVDKIWLATGADVGIDESQLMSSILQMHPVKLVAGLPTLTEDLEWATNSNIYVMGAIAALQLGPDALNIAGARSGASRIAHKLKKEMDIRKT